jgi:hypothetical protein
MYVYTSVQSILYSMTIYTQAGAAAVPGRGPELQHGGE